MKSPKDYLNYKETKSHGTPLFPCAVYSTVIPSTLICYPTHWHTEMEVILVKAGMGTVIINFIPHLLREGDILVIPPGLLHSIEQKDNLFFSYYTLLFDLNMLVSGTSDICSINFIMPLIKGKNLLPVKIGSEVPVSGELQICLTQLIQCHFKRPTGYELYVKSLKFFKSHTDTSFITYLNNYRLNVASELLLTTNLAILNISEQVGFENHSYFIRSFKRKYHLTPAAFRKKYSTQ